MSPEVVWTWSAEADLQRHFNWREDRSEGSGIELLARVEKAAELLLRFPRMAAVWRSPVRRLILKRSTLGLFDVPEPRASSSSPWLIFAKTPSGYGRRFSPGFLRSCIRDVRAGGLIDGSVP